MADAIGNVLQTEFNAFLWWDLRNNQDNTQNNSSYLYGWRQYGDYGILSSPSSFGSSTYYDPYPTYYILKLLSHFARAGDTVVRATTDTSLLAAYAAKRTDGTLALLMINKSPSAPATGTITLTGFTPQATATVYSYGITQDEAARTGTGSADVAQSSLSNAATTFSASFSPYSASVIVFSASTGTTTGGGSSSSSDSSGGGGGGGAMEPWFALALAVVGMARRCSRRM
jgi:alpha-N-arabinofuranosidase